MKNILLSSAAVAALLAVATPAQAQVKLDVGGHMKGYVSVADQDENRDTDTDGSNESIRAVDILRETEIHFSGETTLDNGLTIGVHVEADADGSDNTGGTSADSFDVDESYAYFSGAWGRVNFGAEDGAAYLLQVAAPSADSNIDGIRQYINPVNYALMASGAATEYAGLFGAGLMRLDYDHAYTGAKESNKITYLTPVFSGFQAGATYTPDLDDGVDTGATTARSLNGNGIDDHNNDYGDTWEVAARYEGQMDEIGVTIGAGFSEAELEDEAAAGPLDDWQIWNVGVDLDWGPFGLGVSYMEDDLGVDTNADRETLVIGADYTNGPYKVGVSYLTQDQALDGLSAAASTGTFSGAIGAGVTGDLETDRWTGGVTYTYGPGMTFRGSVSYVDHELPTSATDTDADATSVLLGTQINF